MIPKKPSRSFAIYREQVTLFLVFKEHLKHGDGYRVFIDNKWKTLKQNIMIVWGNTVLEAVEKVNWAQVESSLMCHNLSVNEVKSFACNYFVCTAEEVEGMTRDRKEEPIK